MEPCAKAYYFGKNILNVNGCNYEQIGNELKRSKNYIDESNLDRDRLNNHYEQPYYEWESNLEFNGKVIGPDEGQYFNTAGFRTTLTISFIPLEDYLVHRRGKI